MKKQPVRLVPLDGDTPAATRLSSMPTLPALQPPPADFHAARAMARSPLPRRQKSVRHRGKLRPKVPRTQRVPPTVLPRWSARAVSLAQVAAARSVDTSRSIRPAAKLAGSQEAVRQGCEPGSKRFQSVVKNAALVGDRHHGR